MMLWRTDLANSQNGTVVNRIVHRNPFPKKQTVDAKIKEAKYKVKIGSKL